ncbi:peptidase M48 [Polaromonas sp.]|uniref:peptidase M48 n=1 Tax=Polaromonas sp. TaxID=1869339 RepID=UPI002B75D76C|nr:peptidase M48 [Polaromonas sp.]HQS32082.1 peptidase M48 [Polaromonas sp.]HQS90552.1 peptidase M48 [Polaromonas sp.]
MLINKIVVQQGDVAMRESGFTGKAPQGGRAQPVQAGHARVRWMRLPAVAYAWVAGCLLLSLAMAGWVGFHVARGEPGRAYLWLGLVAAVLLWAGLAALARQLEDTPGVLVTRDDAPALFEAMDRLRDKLKGPPIERVLLDTQFILGIRRTRRFGRFGGASNCLTIGLPLLLALDRRRLLALLAHEYARFHNARGALAPWLDRRLLRLRARLGPARNLARTRRERVHADRIARKLLGRHVAAAALIEFTVKAEWIKREFWPSHWRAAAASMTPMAPYAAMRVLALTPPHEDFAQEVLRQSLALPGNPKDGISPLRERLDALRAGRQLPLWSSSQAITLLGTRGPQWLAEFDRQWCRDNVAEWRLHRAYLARVRARGQFLAGRFRESSADELIEIAELMRRLDVDADVRSLYERILQLAPGHAGALCGLVQCLPDAEWKLRVACASSLFDASESHRCWASRAAVMTLEKYAPPGSSDAELQRWRERREAAEDMERGATRELAESPFFASIEPSDLKEFEKGELLSRLARCPPVARAWLVRKRLTGFGSRRCYIVFLDLPGLSDERRHQVCRELESTLELPGLTLAVGAGRTPTLAEIRRQAFDPVYERAR